MSSFMEDLRYHEDFLLRQMAPLEHENEDLRRHGVSFQGRADVREKIAEQEKTLANVRLLIKREYGKSHR